MTKKHILLTCILFLLTIGVWAEDWQDFDSIPSWAKSKLQQKMIHPSNNNVWGGTRNEFIKWDNEAVLLLDLLYKLSKETIIWAYNNDGNVLVVSSADMKNYLLFLFER